MLLNEPWIREEIKRFLETSEDSNTTYLNMWDVAKAVLRGKFIKMNAYIGKTERNQVNELSIHLKELGKQQKNNSNLNGKRNNENNRGNEAERPKEQHII